MMAIWDFNKNTNLKPEVCARTCSKRAWFHCKEGKCDHHRWEGSIRVAVLHGCPYCVTSYRKRVCICNSLATHNPALAKEWHPTKNDGVKPTEVSPFSSREFWWICLEHKTCNEHVWIAPVRNRQVSGCPFCCKGKKKVCPCNNLEAKASARLKAEWHGDNKPMADYSPGSNRLVSWRCSRNSSHPDWRASVRDRMSGHANCPKCFDYTSAGERRAGEVLQKFTSSILIRHNKGMPPELPPLKFQQGLRFDYVVLPEEGKRDRYCAIEYDGEQHFQECSALNDENAPQRDRLKNIYAVTNKLHLLRISFSVQCSDFDGVIASFFDAVQMASKEEVVIHLVGAEYDSFYATSMFETLQGAKLRS